MVLKNLFIGQQWRNRHREYIYGHWERGGEGELYGKSNMETYITICKIDSQWEFAQELEFPIPMGIGSRNSNRGSVST